MQYIDLQERIIIWVAFDFPGLHFPDFGLLRILRDGRTGFRCSGAPPLGAGRLGAPSRLSDRSVRPQLCTACRSLPAGEILPLAHTNGSPFRSVKHLRVVITLECTEMYLLPFKEYFGYMAIRQKAV